ncbi:MAG TPA: hypothetical protein VF328_24460 [Mycobacterium sp.]
MVGDSRLIEVSAVHATDFGSFAEQMNCATMPIISDFPFPLAVEILPMHLPLPAKIRTELLDPIKLDTDPIRSEDDEYVSSIYREVEAAIQAGMDRLTKRRSFPIFG